MYFIVGQITHRTCSHPATRALQPTFMQGGNMPVLPNQCDLSIAQYTIGQKCTPELLAEVRALANGAPVRATGPKYPSSHDLRPHRINLHTDVDRVIVSINCG
jgi:hypothetical protein